MSPFRRFSRRFWPLHAYLMISMILWPVPSARSYWTDSNQDGVKEWVDETGLDPSWWDFDSDSDGLTNAQEALYGSDPYAKDSDRDGLSDLVERDYTPPSAPFDPWSWDTDGDGYSDHDEYYLLIQGSPLVVHYPSLSGPFYDYRDADGDGLLNDEDSDPANMDRDGDGLLNWQDSHMDDANNGAGAGYSPPSQDSDFDGIPDESDPFPWGSYWYNGIEYGGSWSDDDGDGIPNPADGFPNGSFIYNGVEYGGSSSADRDGDGIPDPADPWPMIAYSFWFNASEYPGIWSDQDGDGIPDAADPFPNGSYWWNANEYAGAWVDSDNDSIPDAQDAHPNGSYWYNGTEYSGTWMDSDGDGLPDPADPFPQGGSYWHNGTEYGGPWSDRDGDTIPDPADATPDGSYWHNGSEYAGSWADTDGDGIPDPADAWPADSWNGQPYFTYNGSEYPGAWEDRDGDGVPDAADSWPDDPENGADDDHDGLSNYDERTQHFTDPAQVDTDHDWLTDYEELYVFHTNPKAPRSGLASGQSLLDGQLHLGADADGDELPDILEDFYASLGYGLNKNDPADGAGDLDSDGYTNAQAFTFGWSLIANRGTYDQDGDGIDDAVEDFWAALYPGSMDKTVFEDAVADHDQDGLMNYEEVERRTIHGWQLPADPGDPYSLMRTLGYEVVPGTTPNDGQLMRWWWDVSRPDYGGVDNDTPGADPALLLDVTDVAPAPNGLPDGYERWLAVVGPETNTARAILADEDGDWMPNLWEHRHAFDPRDGTDAGPATGSLPQAPVAPVAPVAPDTQVVGYVRGPDGVLVWNQDAYDAAESLYQDALAAYPDLLAAYDEQIASLQAYLASVDPDEDGLSNIREHLEGTHPRLADTDGDGYSDGAEVEAGSQPLVVTSMPSIQLQLLSGANQQIYPGSASAPVVLRVVHAGQPVPGKQVRFESLSPGITVAATSGGTAATSLVLAADAAGKVEVCIHAPSSQAAGTVHLQASLEDHLEAPVPFAMVIAEPGIAQLRPDLWAGLSGGGGANGVAFTPGVSAVLLKRSSGVFGGGYSAGTPGTTEPTWVPDGPPVDRQNQTSREEYDNTPGDTVFFIPHDDPDLGTLYTWRKQKMKPGDPIIINGTPASASAYMAANDKYQGGSEVIETAAQVEAKGETGRYAGNIEGFLTFAPMSDADRAAKGMAAENTQARAGKSRYPDAGWSQVWLTTVVPATQDVTRSYLVKRENADGTHTIGSFSLTVKRGDKVSTVSEQTQAVDGLEVSGGIATLKPSVPSTDGEHVTLSLLPVEIDSKDRFLTGAFDTSIDLFKSAQVAFKNSSSGENLGSYKLDGTGGTHIYESKDDIFSDAELDDVVGGSVGASSNKLNQKVVFWKDGSKVRFATTFEGIGSVEISLSKSDGTSLGKITHALKGDSNFSGLIDHLGARIDSINSQAEDQFSLMPDIDGIPDDDDPLPVLVTAAGATAASPPPAEAASNNSWSATTRNLLSKVLIAARNAVDGIKTGAEYTYKVGGGFIKGYVDGVCDGVVSDVTGIGELAIMALESVTGDFHRAKAMYDGIATLASMTSEERGAVFDSMLVKFVDKSTTSVPWDPSEMNGADDWGIGAYMAGYGGGFITEQVVATMAVAGLVSKVGQGVKVALLGTKLGQITAAMIQGVRKFVTGAFLSISKHLKTYGEAAIKSVRLALGEVGASIRGGAGGPTKKVGEWISEMMERVTPQKLKYQELADRLEKICQSRAEWVQLGPNAFWHVSGLAQWLGTHLTEHGVMGFMNLWKGALRHAVSGNYVHHLYNVCTVGGVLDKQGMARILEMFESTSQSAYKFIPDAQDVTKWTSPGGVIYGVGSEEGHRIMHILTHTVPNWANKTNHTVWNVARHEVFSLLDEAWAKKGTWVQALTKNGQPDPLAWICEMGRQVGVGNSTLTKIRVVLIRAGTDEIRSAYPVSSLMP